MHLVEGSLRLPPHKCLVTGRIDGPIVDFNVSPICDQPPNVAIMLTVIEEAAEEFGGMVKRSKYEDLESRMLALSEELDKITNLYRSEQDFKQAKEELEGPLPEKETVNA